MITASLLESNSVRDLEAALRITTAERWNATTCFFLTYNEDKQTLRCRDLEWELRSEVQTDACALQLRVCKNQELPWPEELPCDDPFRMTIPIFHWGSLNAVLALGFAEEPRELEGLEQLENSLGLLGEKVSHREMTENFVSRCKEFLVRVVETQGSDGHVQRCCKLSQALATMLDCSPQVQSELMDAAQYHDIGLLTFNSTNSAEAIREHSLVGASLLLCHPELFRVASIVEAHHERFDGSGQPQGKSGNELPLECWILALVEDFVEFWESSTASYEMKVKEFFSGPARHHHPDAVDALCGLVDSGKLLALVS